MSKLDVAKMNADAVAAYRADPAKNVTKMVGEVITAYTKVAVRLHYAACIATYHAAQSGDVRPLNTFFNGLRQNDKDALRLWVGKLCSYVVEHDDKDDETLKFVTFKKDDGFKIAKNSEAVRVDFFTLEAMLSGQSFMDMDQQAEAKPFGLAELLAMLARVEKQMTKKAAENDLTVPAEIASAVKAMTATITSVGNTLGKPTLQ